jgi:hypothetical protein
MFGNAGVLCWVSPAKSLTEHHMFRQQTGWLVHRQHINIDEGKDSIEGLVNLGFW